MEKGNVAVSPGSGFGPAGEGFLRMSLVENEARLRQAVRQIQRVPARGGGAILGRELRCTSCREHVGRSGRPGLAASRSNDYTSSSGDARWASDF